MLLARVRRTLRERRLISPGDRVLVAVSGGPDSMAMLDVLSRLARGGAFELSAASIDHGLRAEAADEVALAGAHAARLGIAFHALRVDVGTRGSLQARARLARYAALHELAARLGATRIAVGHTRDDQAETVLARMLRGSGARGLAGIAPRRADGVVRPLLDATRTEARSWCDAHAIAFVTDPSNSDPRFQRVRIRSELLPRLALESPAIGAHLAAIADDARALTALAKQRGRRLLEASRRPGGLDCERLSHAPEAARREALRVWAEVLCGRMIRRAHLDGIESALQGLGEALLPGGWVARREGSLLVPVPPPMFSPDEEA